ncbi:MAG: NAD-dependent epimerase/dehydratase family protein [Thaumarchaeota archaeon]|nr:NAD-dependent epimerase/dehydratase family protein [Nitrososphaerota archaeon]
MKVLVTGASGFVARHVIEYLSSHGHEPVPTDVVGGLNQGSVADKSFVFDVLSKLEFESVVHLAGIADLRKTLENPHAAFEVNSYGTLNMLELASRKNVKRFVYASSANVYGAPKRNPVAEDAPFDPRVPYDYSKVAGESFAVGYYKSKGLPVAITRSWLLFGEYDALNRAVPRFVKSCLENQPIKLFNSGRDTTAPSHAVNYGKLVASLLDKREAVGEAFNFGGERVLTIRELAELVKKLTGSSSELQMLPPRSEAETEPQVSYPSTKKMMEKLQYSYEIDLETGLRRTADWMKKLSS